jgi:hypothetical protein
MKSDIFENWGATILICIVCTPFTKTLFDMQKKIENELFMHRKGNHPK